MNRPLPDARAAVSGAELWDRPSTAAGPLKAALLVAAGLAAVVLLSLVVQRVEATLVLAGMLGVAALTFVLINPGLAVALVGFVIYLNVPAMLTQELGLPEIVAGSVILLLGVPLVSICVLHRERLKSDTTLKLMLGFLGVLLLSSTLSVDPTMALGRVRTFLFEGVLLFWLFINVIRDITTLRRLMVGLLAAGTIVSALSLYQDMTGNYDEQFLGLAHRSYNYERDGSIESLSGDRTERGRFDRAQGPVNEPNRFAQIMIVLVPMAVYLFRTGRSRVFRLTVAVMGAFAMIGIVLTLSRGAMVALLLMGIMMAAIGWVRTSRLALVLTGGLLLIPLFAPFYLARIASLANVTYLAGADESEIRGADGAMRGRLTEMLAALNVFLDYPLVGVGPGLFSPYYVQDYSRDPDIQFRDIREARRAHTLYLEVAAETGILGLIGFMTIVGMLLMRLWRARQALAARAPGLADLATACWLSLMAYLVTAIFLHLSYQRYYWLLLAIGTAALHVISSEASRRRLAGPVAY